MAVPVMSQDIHWSQFNDNQLFQNPVMLAILIELSIYRVQRSMEKCPVPFSTTAISVDGKFKKFGIGVIF